MAAAIAGGGLSTSARGREVLDRVVASVDSVAITRTDIEMAYGFELFLKGQAPKPAPDNTTLEAVRDRQIDQLLLSHEADLEEINPSDVSAAATDTFESTRKKFHTAEEFQAALRALEMNEEQALERLRQRQRILTLIDRRLRTSARVEPPDIQDYYRNTFLPDAARKGIEPVPPLADVDEQIREILTQKKINELLGAWLDNLKSSHRVTVNPL